MLNKPKSYHQQEQRPQQVLSWWESVSSTITNIRYEANKTISEFKQKIFQPEEDTLAKQIIIQGKKYQTRKQAKQAVRRILWFSYRKGFNIKNEYKSDVGWGCLVRVGQMALASALDKHFESQNQRLNFNSSESDIENLIAAFSDIEGMYQKYSLNKIVQVAGNQFQIKAGEWFNISSISVCLKTLQNQHPMRGASGMKIVFFDQSIDVPVIFSLENLPVCKCTKKALICERCHSNYKRQTHSMLIKNEEGEIQTFNLGSKGNEESINKNFMKKEKVSSQTKGISMHYHHRHTINSNSQLELFRKRVFDKDLCLFVLTRVGDPKEVQNSNKAIFALLDLSFCLGIMTGFPRQAIFVVGRQGSKLIYLNPHYVQQHQTKDMSKKDSHFCQQYLLCERTQLDPSMGFCFYIQNLAQLQHLNNTINQINYIYRNSLSIGIDYGWHNYDPKDYLEQEDNDEDNFSSLSFQSTFHP